MCGRFVQNFANNYISSAFSDGRKIISSFSEVSDYNKCPGERVVAILANGADLMVEERKWGISLPKGQLMINTRSEDLPDRPFWKSTLKLQKVLIPTNGYYEWKREPSSNVPYYLYGQNENELLWMAALQNQEGFLSILTRQAISSVAHIHHRMPLFLRQKRDQQGWLFNNVEDAEQIRDWALSRANPNLQFHCVSTRINRTRDKDQALTKKVAPPPQQLGLF